MTQYCAVPLLLRRKSLQLAHDVVADDKHSCSRQKADTPGTPLGVGPRSREPYWLSRVECLGIGAGEPWKVGSGSSTTVGSSVKSVCIVRPEPMT